MATDTPPEPIDPALFDCPVNDACHYLDEAPVDELGDYEVAVEDGRLVVGEPWGRLDSP